MLDPQSIVEFNTWFHREDPPCEELHEKLLEGIEKAWHQRFSAPEHDDMSQVPAYLAEDRSSNMWSNKSITQEQALQAGVADKLRSSK